jgi:hypothetical protein
MKPCKCGKFSMLGEQNTRFFVCCSNPLCWDGPARDTQAEAEAAWDLLMSEEPKKAVRMPVALAAGKWGVMVVCNDGSAFDIEDQFWIPVAAIPGTEADK